MNRCPQCWKLFAPPVDAYPQHVGCIPLPPHATAYLVELLTEIAEIKRERDGLLGCATRVQREAWLAAKREDCPAFKFVGKCATCETQALVRYPNIDSAARALTDGETPQ